MHRCKQGPAFVCASCGLCGVREPPASLLWRFVPRAGSALRALGVCSKYGSRLASFGVFPRTCDGFPTGPQSEFFVLFPVPIPIPNGHLPNAGLSVRQCGRHRRAKTEPVFLKLQAQQQSPRQRLVSGRLIRQGQSRDPFGHLGQCPIHPAMPHGCNCIRPGRKPTAVDCIHFNPHQPWQHDIPIRGIVFEVRVLNHNSWGACRLQTSSDGHSFACLTTCEIRRTHGSRAGQACRLTTYHRERRRPLQ